MTRTPRCSVCGDVIGVYEPLIIVTTTGTRTTSLAKEPELIDDGAELTHLACAESASDVAGGSRRARQATG